jgi:uncharacterized protein YgiM (DUF1202 family)
MTFRRTTISLTLLLRVAASFLCWTGVSGAAPAVLSGIEMVGGPKGVALTLRADASFPVKIEEKASPKKSGQVLVGIHCMNVIYGLEDFTFATFPRGCPVSRIGVSENAAGNSIDMIVAVDGSLDRPAISKQKETKWVILLSRNPAPVFSWSAAPQAKVAAAPPLQEPPARGSGSSRLTDVSVMVRDNVEVFTFSFDVATTMRFKSEKDKIVVLFVNATSGLPETRFTPENDPTSAVEFKQIAHGGTMWLGASVYMPPRKLENAVMRAFPERLVIYTTGDSLQSLSLWSAAKGRALNYKFAKLPRLEVDVEGIKKKAMTDIAGTLQKAKTFTVREETGGSFSVASEQTPSASVPVASAKQPPAVRLIVMKDNTSLRSAPTAGNNEIARLLAGDVTTLLQKKQGWMHVRTQDDTAGWLPATSVTDSARASRAILEQIEKTVQTRLAQQKAAEEKAARVEAAKEKAAQEKLAKEKLAAERETQKKAALEAKAAARDSADREAKKNALGNGGGGASMNDTLLRFAVGARDSAQMQSEKSITARQQVEYHIYGRDPFVPLTGEEDSKVRNVQDLSLVGILYDQADRIALFETSKGKEKAVALRENDPVQNGYVLKIQPDKVLFLLNELGISRTYALKLFRDKEK